MQTSQKVLIGTGAGLIALAAIAASAGPLMYREFLSPHPDETPAIHGDADMLSEAAPELGAADPQSAEREANAASEDEPQTLTGTVELTAEGRIPEGSRISSESAEFALTRAATLEGDTQSSAGRSADAEGELTIGGVTRTVTASFTVPDQPADPDGPQEVRLAGTIPVTFAEFGVQPASLGFADDELQGALAIDVAAVPPAE